MNDITALSPVTPEVLASLKLSAMNLAEGEMMSFEPAVFLALVEALESGNTENERMARDLIARDGEIEGLRQRAAELEAIHAAVEKLVRCKGRYHSEQNYRALAALFGVNAPDLPPLDGESRAVELPLPACTYADHSYPAYSKRQVVSILAAAGIQVIEGEG